MKKLFLIPVLALVMGLSFSVFSTSEANAREHHRNDRDHNRNAQSWYGERGNRPFRVPPGHRYKKHVRHRDHDRYDRDYSRGHGHRDDNIWYDNGYDRRHRDYRRHDYRRDHHRHYRHRDDDIDFLSLGVALPGVNLVFGSVNR